LRTCLHNTVQQKSLASSGVTLKIRHTEDQSLIENYRLEEPRSLLFQHTHPVHSLNTKDTTGISKFCYLVPLRPKYPPQHPILQHPRPTFLPQCERQSFTPTQNKNQDYSSVYLSLCILGQQTGTLYLSPFTVIFLLYSRLYNLCPANQQY
jgi:hypothetical protein